MHIERSARMGRGRRSAAAALALLATLGARPLVGQVAGAFTYLGPSSFGGRVRTVIFHPTDPSIGWLGAVGGGVFKTTDGGNAWFPVGDGMTNMLVTTLIVNPSNPSVLYAGTGEFANTYGTPSPPGDGVHRSTDGGASWTHLTATDNASFRTTFGLALNPAQASHVYAATLAGVFRSTDSGTSWTAVYTDTSNPDVPDPDCRSIAVKAGSAGADVVLASCLTDRVIVRNPDAAGAGVFSIVKQEADLGKASFAFAPSQPDLVYALASKLGTPSYPTQVEMLALFKSTNAGATWSDVVRQNGNVTLLRNLLLSSAKFANAPTCNGGASYIYAEGSSRNALAVDPIDPNRLFAAGEDFYRSTDGGVTWALGTNGAFVSPSPGMRFGHYAFAFPAGYDGVSKQTLWIANSTGLYRTTNAVSGTTFTDPCTPPSGTLAFTRQNTGHAAAFLADGSVFPGGATYYAATDSFDVVKGTDAAGPTGWTSFDVNQSNPRSTVLADPTNLSVIYRGGFNQGLEKTTNGGTSWFAADAGQTGIGFERSATVLDPATTSRLFTGREQMFRTTNGGTSWQAASTAFGSVSYGGRVYTDRMLNVVVAPSDPGTVVAAIGHVTVPPFQGHLRLFTMTSGLASTGSTAWTAHDPGGEFVARHALAIDPTNPQVLWLHRTTGGRVAKSTDFGATWTARGNGLPDKTVTTLLIDPAVPGRLFAGTNEGLYSTTDDGLSWTREPGIPRAPVSRTVLDGRSLFVFTAGRGAWRANLNACASKGDVNGDGSVSVGDVFVLIKSLFAGGPSPVCSANVNGDVSTDVLDLFFLINFLFAGGPAPM
jgi:photosystem II stability/assembly factor-like uncharacterized protein